MTEAPATDLASRFMERQRGALPDHLGHAWENVREGFAKGRFTVAGHHMAPNGFLHAASVIALADTACGYGCVASLPEGASGFATVELKTNFMGTARSGEIVCEARLVHASRTLQTWDAEVRHEDTGRLMALFRCTQSILYPKS